MNVKQGTDTYMLGIKSLAVTIHFQLVKPLNIITFNLFFTLKLCMVFKTSYSITN